MFAVASMIEYLIDNEQCSGWFCSTVLASERRKWCCRSRHWKFEEKRTNLRKSLFDYLLYFQSKSNQLIIRSQMTWQINKTIKVLFDCLDFFNMPKSLLIFLWRITGKIDHSDHHFVQLFCSHSKHYFQLFIS